MRFNALGPPLARGRRFTLFGVSGSNPATQGLLGVVLIIGGSILLRLVVLHMAYAHLAEQQARLTADKTQMAVGASVQTQLNGYQAFASDYGEVRDSGYSVGSNLVSIWNAWPDPSRTGSSLQCLKPSEDGKTYIADGVGRSYDAYSSSVHSLDEAGFQAVTRNQQSRDIHQSFTLEISHFATPAPTASPLTVGSAKAVRS